VELHDGPGSVRAFEKLAGLVPSDAVALMQLGEAYRDVARYQDAVRVIRQALAAGARFSGCTVHFVRPETDSGPIIAQAVVPVHDDDDEERLARRILAEEHRLYPLALRLCAEGRLRIDGNRVTVAGGNPPEIAALNPAL
jgi:tetratricopeptide (TPR) repeat protein